MNATAPWQAYSHVQLFDRQAKLPTWLLKKSIERFHEGQMLRDVLTQAPVGTRLVEIGCATGELSRYVRQYFPRVTYHGYDISAPAIARARQKYPRERFDWTDTDLHGVEAGDVVFCRDVVHHQLDPWGFLETLVSLTRRDLILRLRTREHGDTVLDAAQSYQVTPSGRVPYLVLNRTELWHRLPFTSVTAVPHYLVLGDCHGRHLPAACAEPRTLTAETAVWASRIRRAPCIYPAERLSWPLPYALVVRLYGAA